MSSSSKTSGLEPGSRTLEKWQPLYEDAEKALKRLDELLGQHRTSASASIVGLAETVIQKDRRLVLYIGAGCSQAVVADTELGQGSWKGCSWIELLQRLLEHIPKARRDELLASLRQRVELSGRVRKPRKVEDLLKKLDRLLIAWFITHAFPNPKQRNDAIYRVVEPPPDAVCRSPLHDELLSLPFDDIVTTNYDGNIARFLSSRSPRIEFDEITSAESLALTSSLKGGRPRLLYLHGKAGLPDAKLIFDRFDYAELMLGRDGMLDYVTYLLRDAHVLYVGFGMDDPTFNLMETRLNKLHGMHRPESFAFVAAVTEKEREEFERRNLYLIDYGKNHTVLPKILECVNTIRRFANWAEPNRRAHARADRDQDYVTLALQQYVKGDFIESLLNFRAALASTLFWEKELRGAKLGPVLTFENAARVCEIRIRMALNHYKLNWKPDRELLRTHSIRPREALRVNMKAADEIINSMKAYPIGKIRPERRNLLLGLENSLKVLHARIAYHEGDFKGAQRIYNQVISASTVTAMRRERGDTPPKVISKLRLSEGYCYASAQKSRIDYQFLDRSSATRLEERQKQVESMKRLAQSTESIRDYIESRKDTECGKLAEWAYFKHSFATLHCIALWTAGRHAVRVCRDVLPTRDERTLENIAWIEEGLGLLHQNPVGEGAESKSMTDTDLLHQNPVGEGAESKLMTDTEVWPSRRWRALRYRYLARGYGLKWVIKCSQSAHSAAEDDDLVLAYRYIQMAIDEATGPGLERQRVVNFLEAARLNVFAIFGERLRRAKEPVPVSPLSLAAGIHYLDIAFSEISMAAQRDVDVSWLEVLGRRLASYFSAVSGLKGRQLAHRVTQPQLAAFFKTSADDMCRDVSSRYRSFGRKIGDASALIKRISYYVKGFGAIRTELQQLKRTKRAPTRPPRTIVAAGEE